MTIIIVVDIVESNGKTIRQNNLAQQHNIALGSLVEIVAPDSEYDDNPTYGLRLFVVNHSRDCDGTPLYDLSFNKNAQKEYDEYESQKEQLGNLYQIFHWKANGALLRHYGEDSLKLIV